MSYVRYALLTATLFAFLSSPAQVETADAAAYLGGPSYAAKACCYDPCIKYRHRHGRVCCKSCAPPIQTVLAVADPCCCGCVAEVPVCIPACCVGTPCVTSRCGLFRGHVTYSWPCGYKVDVAIGKRSKQITVTYHGL